MGIHFGFDIGVSSVGFCAVNNDYDILELGSSLFPCANASENVTRRQMRGNRRLLRRRKTRIKDFQKLFSLATNFDISSLKPIINILELKNKGLNEKLEINELYFVLLNYIKHKGISYLDDEILLNNENENEDITNKKLSPYQKSLTSNINISKEKLPCEIQLERFKKQGKFHSDSNYNYEDDSLNIFSTNKYKEEITKILDTQCKYYDFILKEHSFNNYFATKQTQNNSLSFKKHFLYLFSRKREYYVGPGNEKSRTDYGIYKTQKDENGNFKTIDNIFEELVGKCSIYNGKNGSESEYRTSMSSFTAEYFNVVNDLNNIKINNEKLTKEERTAIIQEMLKKDKLADKGVEKIILDVCHKKDGTISGNRINKKGEAIYSHFDSYRKLRNHIINDLQINIDMNSSFSNNTNEKINKIDKIMDILTLNTERDSLYTALKNSKSLNNKDNTILNLSDEIIESLIKFRLKNSTLFSKWHSFSKKLINEILPEMLDTGKEQMSIIIELKKQIPTNLTNKKLSKNEITEEIYNPVVKRSIRKCIDILNALIKKYGAPEEIVIEMPRDDNDDEENKRIKKEQEKNEKELNDIKEYIEKSYGVILKDEHYRNHKNLVLTLKLWKEQDEKCAYSLEPIKIEDILYNYDNFEIDHIIPLSISLDDSRNNKVLVKKHENQKKRQRTAFNYIETEKSKEFLTKWIHYINEIFIDEKKKKNKKAFNLLFNEDITKREVVSGFISRNLNDTRYASRTFLNACQSYFKNNNLNTKIKVIRGSFTHTMRTGLGIKKERNEDFSHHAIDAVLIAFSQMGYDTFKSQKNQIIDFETGEILDKNKYDNLIKNNGFDEMYKDILYQSKWFDIKTKILQAKQNVKYIHFVDKKPNRQIADQTIYGTRNYNNEIYKVSKISLNDQKIKSKFNDFINNKYISLIQLHDQKTWEKLISIYNNYENEKNPFIAYTKDTGKPITKYAKNDDGPIISNIKYLDGKIGSNIDISHKFKLPKNSKKVVLMQLKPFRTDVYFNESLNQYKYIGIKYNHLHFSNNKIIINQKSYENLLLEEGILNKKEWVFVLSFYKNNKIKYEKDGKVFFERFSSLNNKNVIETKPIAKKQFDNKTQNLISVTKAKNIKKVLTDTLGNDYEITNEKFKAIF